MSLDSLLPRLLIISPTLTFAIEFIVNVIQYIHLSRFDDSSFHTITAYLYNNNSINTIRLEIIESLLNLFVTLLLWLVMPILWIFLSKRRLFTFIIAYDFYILLFHKVPEYFILGYFTGDYKFPTLDDVASALALVFYQEIICLILYYIGRWTKLNPSEDEQPQQQQQTENIDNNNETNHNNQNQQRPATNERCHCCQGHFWLVFLILSVSLIFLINYYIVDYLMFDPTDFVKIDNQTIAQPLMNLTAKVNFPYENVYMQISAAPNAFYTGIFDKKVIIIAQSLMRIVTDPMDLSAVVAHELGHWAHKDLVKSFIFSLVISALFCLVMKPLAKIGFSSIGLNNDIPVVIFMICLSTLLMFPQLVFMVILNVLSRNFETNADCYAAQLGYPIAEALTILTKGVLGDDVESAGIYSWFYENHPPLSKRVEHVRTCIVTS